jgi:hypothetical protein
MQIPDDSLDDFVAVYKKEVKKKLNRAEASEVASRLLTLYELLAKKLPNEQDHTPKPPESERPPLGFHK